MIIPCLLLTLLSQAAGDYEMICANLEKNQIHCETANGCFICPGDFLTLHQYHPNVEHLTIYGSNDEHLNPVEILRSFPNVRQLRVVSGHISFVTDFPKNQVLESVLLSGLSVAKIPVSLFQGLENLKMVNLSGNHLDFIDPIVFNGITSLKEIYLGGNPWDCKSNWSWILDSPFKIVDVDKMLCKNLYPGKAIKDVFTLLEEIRNQCAENICSCSLINIVWDLNRKHLHPVITVNCSNQQLKELPEMIPRSATILHLEHNQISDLTPLANNSLYESIQDIYLDNNSITSIDSHEGAEWLKRFRVLSLRNNYIKQVRSYALNHAFEQNRNIISVYLSGNPWKCDCAFTPSFQLFLLKYHNIFKDLHSIKCEENGDQPYSLMQVLEVPRSEICRSEIIDLNPWDILSAILASLILLIFGKLVYDYWRFRQTGRLPWIATKIP